MEVGKVIKEINDRISELKSNGYYPYLLSNNEITVVSKEDMSNKSKDIMDYINTDYGKKCLYCYFPVPHYLIKGIDTKDKFEKDVLEFSKKNKIIEDVPFRVEMIKECSERNDFHIKDGRLVTIGYFNTGKDIIWGHIENLKEPIKYHNDGIPYDNIGEEYNLYAYFDTYFNFDVAYKRYINSDGIKTSDGRLRELCLSDGTPIKFDGWDSTYIYCIVNGKREQFDKKTGYPSHNNNVKERLCFKYNDIDNEYIEEVKERQRLAKEAYKKQLELERIHKEAMIAEERAWAEEREWRRHEYEMMHPDL